MQSYTSANDISEPVWVWPMSGVDGFDTVEIHSDVFSPDWKTCTVQTVHTTCTESQLCQSSLGGREWSGISRPSTTNNIAGFLWNVNHMRIVSVGVTRNLKFTMTFPWELEKRGLVSADYIRHSLQSHLAITFTNCLHLFSFKILINQWNNIKKFQLINILRNDIEDFLHHGI